MGKQIVAENTRVSWPKIAKAEGNPNYPANAPTYSISLLLDPKADKAVIKKLQDAMDEVAGQSTAKKAPDYPPSWEPKDNGMIELRATAQENWRRQVVDENLEPIPQQLIGQQIYAGCYCNVAVDIYLQPKYNKVCVGLLAVQKAADGEPLSGAPEASDLFKPIKVSGNNPDPLG